MIKLMIIHSCLSFHTYGVKQFDLNQVLHLQKAAIECKEKFNGCLAWAKFTNVNENGFKVKYRCIAEKK